MISRESTRIHVYYGHNTLPKLSTRSLKNRWNRVTMLLHETEREREREKEREKEDQRCSHELYDATRPCSVARAVLKIFRSIHKQYPSLYDASFIRSTFRFIFPVHLRRAVSFYHRGGKVYERYCYDVIGTIETKSHSINYTVYYEILRE